MCGRYVLYGPITRLRDPDSPRTIADDLAQLVDEYLHSEPSRYNIAPGSQVPVVVRSGRDLEIEVHRWGLKESGKPFNIRGDSAGKPWAKALLRNRVIFPASGFYEWQARAGGQKTPHYFLREPGELLAIAGVLGNWEGPGVAMMTTEANAAVRPVHDRMPVILDAEGIEAWLDPAAPLEAILALLRPAPDGALRVYPVGKKIGNSRNEGPDLIDPARGFTRRASPSPNSPVQILYNLFGTAEPRSDLPGQFRTRSF